MFQKALAYWNSLPAAVKVPIVIFAGAATGVIKHALTAPDACFLATCLKAYAFSALHAGGIAVIAYLLPSPLASAAQGQAQLPPAQK